MKNLKWLHNGRQLLKDTGKRPTVASISSIHNAKTEEAAGIIGGGECLPRFKKPSLKDIPGPWPSLPVLGTSWQYTKLGPYAIDKLHEANMDKYRRHGNIMKEEFVKGCPMLQLYDPADFETILRNQGKHPARPSLDAVCHYRLGQPDKYKSVGLTNAQGEEWYELRNALTPVLMKMKTIIGYLPQQNEVCLDFVRLLHHKKNPETSIIEDFQAELYKLSLESVSMLCLDTRLGCLDRLLSKDTEAANTISATQGLFLSFQMLYYGLPLWKFYKTTGYKLLEKSEAILYSTVSRYIDKALEKLSETKGEVGYERQSVLESLVSTPNIHSKDVRMTIIDFIVAGIDTVSNTLTYVFYQLAKNPGVQQKLYEEINRVLPDKKLLDADSLSNLPYLKATIKEVFRINPTIPGIVRLTHNEHTLSGYQVPKNTPAFCHFMITSQIPEYFADPQSLRPERWIGSKKSHPFAVLPFGYGARMCVGRRFAEQEIYTSVATILQHFRVELAQKSLGSVYRFLVVPDSKLSLKFHNRT